VRPRTTRCETEGWPLPRRRLGLDHPEPCAATQACADGDARGDLRRGLLRCNEAAQSSLHSSARLGNLLGLPRGHLLRGGVCLPTPALPARRGGPPPLHLQRRGLWGGACPDDQPCIFGRCVDASRQHLREAWSVGRLCPGFLAEIITTELEPATAGLRTSCTRGRGGSCPTPGPCRKQRPTDRPHAGRTVMASPRRRAWRPSASRSPMLWGPQTRRATSSRSLPRAVQITTTALPPGTMVRVRVRAGARRGGSVTVAAPRRRAASGLSLTSTG